jgi:cobalt-precorrin 5A hydrolase
MIVAGIGCRRGVSTEAILALLVEAGSRLVKLEGDKEKPQADKETIAALAVPAFRHGEPGIAEAATRLDLLPILWVEREALKGEQGRCLTRSARAEAEVGLSCVAEAAALSAAGEGSRLILPRIAGGGVTCALAERRSK